MANQYLLERYEEEKISMLILRFILICALLFVGQLLVYNGWPIFLNN